ncbi:hypothetical protein Tco_1501123 [Tanacetum coccineum]
MIDYSLWEVIENGNAHLITKVVEGVETTISPTTAEEKAQRRLELKARSTLLMGIPNEHQLKFNSIKDAKSLLLEIMVKVYLMNYVNRNFLRSLSPEWNTHTIVWRNKPEIDTLSLDDLYNNLKIYEPEEILEETTGRKFFCDGTRLLGLIRLRWECYNFHKGVNFGRGSAGLHGNQENLKEGDHKKGNFMPLKPNFSFSGLEEFVNEPIVREPTVKKPVVKTSETKASEAKPKAVRKNKGAPIIKD